jgi:hypothetical protein
LVAQVPLLADCHHFDWLAGDRMSDITSLVREGNRLLLLLLICLKITGDLTWPWTVILSPAWVPMLGLMLGLASMIGATQFRRARRSPKAPASRPVLLPHSLAANRQGDRRLGS